MIKFKSYKTTLLACYLGYCVQALINFMPLLYVTFQTDFGISFAKISLLTAVLFIIQIAVDLIGVKLVDKIGYRPCIVTAHAFSACGQIMLALLPDVMDPYTGIMISTCFYAMGSGLIEVMISPIVEACPTKNKASSMGFLHSCYCWGAVAIILLSTLFFATVGLQRWRILSLLWAILPLANGVFFLFVPMYTLTPTQEQKVKSQTPPMPRKKVVFIFILLILAMVCAGATEAAVGQWASAFAETGLGVNKSLGDLFGPAAFALLMAICRVIYSRLIHEKRLTLFLIIGIVGCILSFIFIAFIPVAAINLIGCGLCGLSVGILWPGILSLATTVLPTKNTQSFAIMALGGDIGCSVGPAVVALCSTAFADNLQIGFGFGLVFPLLALGVMIAITLLTKQKKQTL